MKSATNIELDKSWWKKEQPAGLKKSASGFEKAVEEYAKAAQAMLKTDRAWGYFESTLKQVEKAAKAVVAEAKDLEKKASDKKVKEDLKNTIAVMERPLTTLIASERKRAKALEAEDSDEPGGQIADPVAYGAYLKAMAGKLKKGQMNFAIGMPTNNPADMRMLLHRSSKGKGMVGKLKQEIKAKKFTYGIAGSAAFAEAAGDEVSAQTLVLEIHGKPIPGLTKRVRQMLKAVKVGAFSKVKILEGGKEISDDDGSDAPPGELDMEDQAAELDEIEADEAGETEEEKPEADEDTGGTLLEQVEAGLAKLAPGIKEVLQIHGKASEAIAKQIAAIRAAGTSDDGEAVKAALGQLSDFIKKLAAIPKPPPGPKPPEQKAAPSDEDIEKLREKLKGEYAALAADLKTFLKRGEPSLTGKARQLAQGFNALIAGPDLAKASNVLSTLKNFLAAHVPNLPAMTAMEQAADAVAAGTKDLKARYEKVIPLGGKYPKGAQAAKDAMDGFAAVLGDQPVTDALIETAGKDIEAVREEMKKPAARLKAAMALPAGEKRDAAIKLAEADVKAVQDKIDKAVAFEKAARGKKALTEAMTFGPLSANSKQKFSDDTAALLIAGFVRDPEIATVALGAAETAKYPDAVAQGLGKVLDAKDTGFADKNKKAFANEKTSAEYAGSLLKMGAACGPDFFNRMPEYIASGRQHVQDPLGDLKTKDPVAKAQKRSVAVGGKLLDANGNIDTKSQDAKDAIGDLLFSPYSLREPMPAMNEHMLGTIAFLEKPENATKANEILGGIPDKSTHGARKLVRSALGKKSKDPVSKKDVQTSVMASMLKPLTQGPVGSCFATAPVRRMRQTDPLGAMKAYADIAGTGKYKPAFGPEVPVVTRLPKNEDPIMRSWEYSLATSTERTAQSDNMKQFGKQIDTGLGNLAIDLTDMLIEKGEDIGGLKGFGKALLASATHKSRAKKLKKVIADSFELTYDPTSTIVDSSDGKSSTGRYILVRKDTGAEVRSEQDMIDQISDIAMKVMDVDPKSPDAAKIKAAVSDPTVIGEMQSDDYKPWAMPSGGQTTAATQTLLGRGMKQRTMIAKGDATTDESDRTKEVLTGLVENFYGTSEEMLTIRTVGMHGFNALPNDPSLAKLKAGGKDNIAENIENELVKPGETIKDTEFPAEKAAYLFDKATKQCIDDFIDDDPEWRKDLLKDIATRRPTGPMKPADLEARINEAIDVCSAQFADPAGAAADMKEMAAGKIKTAILKDLGGPEFVVADANWGGADNHVFFVVAPDPSTGKPLLWEKTVPPGSLRPAGREWVDKKWAKIK